MKRSLSRRALLQLLAALISLPAVATTVVMPTDTQLVEKSPLIVIAEVTESSPVERNGGIWTDTRLQVKRVLRGEGSGTLIVREVGGEIGDRVTVVFGSPRYSAGEQVLAFLAPTPRGDFQTVDLFVGKFSRRVTSDGRPLWFRDDRGAGTIVLGADFQPKRSADVQRDAQAFESWIERAVGGETASADYWIEKPRFADSVGTDFTLIDEPNVYRWFAFDDGATVNWRHTGTQAGYANGGIGELQTGLGVWSSYSGAKIRYAYAGASSSAPGGLDFPNGINEVMFGDPKSEIQGSWNGSSGVVGRGGFNSLKGFRGWTSPFAGDASHPAKTYSGVGDIAEANLVIQDGVSPATNISSALLAEIIAHEFGHTLALGHSSDSSALMFSSVTGLGAGLRGDDQLAARWLYPASGGGSSTTPAAPSNLTAIGSGKTLLLSWKDNATDETGQTVYLGTSSGSLLPVQSVGANVTSAVVPNLIAGQLYYARVTASNAAGESAQSNIAQAVVPGDVLKAAFQATPTSGIKGITLFTFIDKSTGPVASRQWSYGDGGSGTGATATYIYQSAGTFTVTLRVFDAQGNSSTAQRQVVVGGSASSIAAAFTRTPNDPVAGEEVSFSDQSVGPITQWLWNFGDGATSTERNPRKRYSDPGLYEVALTVSNQTESSTAIVTLFVGAGSGVTPTVEARIDLSTLWPGAGNEVRFYDRSTGSPNSRVWNFGDGTGSTDGNPVHVFRSSGTYVVSLRAGNNASSASTEVSVIVAAARDRFHSLLPVATLTEGAGDSFWRTELSIFNPDSNATNIDLLFTPTAGLPTRRSFVLAGGASTTWDNTLVDAFGLFSGSGSVSIEANGASVPNLRIGSRTFTTGARGTYGQYVPAFGASSPVTTFLPGLEWSAEFRSNIGVVNFGSVAVSITLSLFDASGSLIANLPMTLGPGEFQQTSLVALFPQIEGEVRKGLLLRIQTLGATTVAGYASQIDNRSQDPIFVPAKPSAKNAAIIVPAVARTAGAQGTFWRSDVVLFNPSFTMMDVSLQLLGGGQAARAVTLAAGETRAIPDVMTFLGEGNGQGPLRIVSTGADLAPMVSSRTYTTLPDGSTFGQWIDGAFPEQFKSLSYVIGLRSDEDFRTNVGLVNAGDSPVSAKVALMNSVGVAATSDVVVPARASIQTAISALFSGDTAALGSFSIRVQSDSPLFAYGSVIDNRSGDPIFVGGY